MFSEGQTELCDIPFVVVVRYSCVERLVLLSYGWRFRFFFGFICKNCKSNVQNCFFRKFVFQWPLMVHLRNKLSPAFLFIFIFRTCVMNFWRTILSRFVVFYQCLCVLLMFAGFFPSQFLVISLIFRWKRWSVEESSKVRQSAVDGDLVFLRITAQAWCVDFGSCFFMLF